MARILDEYRKTTPHDLRYQWKYLNAEHAV